jgi:YYY domain-containing protein
MNYLDILFLFKWWGVFFFIGIVCLPITLRFFSDFFDRGYIFSKIIGSILLSYCVFIFGISHLFKFSFTSIAISFFLLGVGNVFFLYKTKPKTIMPKLKIFILEELLFFIAIFAWSYIRSTQPNINGLEKFMDFGFINSILRSAYFPPLDMWYSPLPINYYYFGHLVTAVITKFSGLPSNISFNLMLATIFAYCLVGTFSLGSNLIYLLFKHMNMQNKDILESQGKLTLKKSQKITIFFGGILTAFVTTFAGNLQTIYAFFKPYTGEEPTPFWRLVFMPQTFPNSYWYPNATRFIYHTIHEFPLYSFVVSDLHGHVLDIPLVLLTTGILLSLFLKTFGKGKIEIVNLIFIGFLLGCMYMTNAWDGGIYLLATLLVAAWIISYKQPGSLYDKLLSLKLLSYVGILLGSFFVFTFPFSHFFNAGELVSGIGVLCAPNFLSTSIGKLGPFLFEANHCQHSQIWELAILYGFFYFWVVGLLSFLLRKGKIYAVDYFILLLTVLATFLIILPEFFYLKDIYPAHYRANTMFKLVYQAFILLSIVSSYCIIRLLTNFKSYMKSSFKRILISGYFLLGLILFSLVAIYPSFAIPSYYGNLQDPKGLDGTKYLQSQYPTDYAAITWLNANIKGQPVILEAQGDSYTDYARVSANTGLPTVLGWTVHEWLWRGSYDPLPARIEDIKQMYESASLDETKSLLAKYNVKLVFIGDLERKKYLYLNEYKFNQLGKIIYRNGITSVYLIN